MNSDRGETIEVRLAAVRYAAHGINLYEFSRPDLAPLPSAEAGAHIGLHLAENLVRQYSLVEGGVSPAAYVVAVKRDAQSRGGSKYVFDELKVGDVIAIDPPRNNFALDETAAHSVFIAGGIGITPIHAMIGRLRALGRSWELHYACRNRAETPFLAEFEKMQEVHLHFDEEAAGTFLDLGAIIGAAPEGAHFYCCGPAPMLSAFEEATASRPSGEVHVEYFTPKEELDLTGEFVVRLEQSGQEFVVPEGKTILQVLREAGLDVPFSCEEGICGACETPVLSGIPDHHDSILTEAEREANDTMMICCGRAKSDRLVLDL